MKSSESGNREIPTIIRLSVEDVHRADREAMAVILTSIAVAFLAGYTLHWWFAAGAVCGG